MAAKRADDLGARTLVAWDIDPIAKTIAAYRAEGPTQPVTYGLGQSSDAEPAVPGWRLAVDDIFP